MQHAPISNMNFGTNSASSNVYRMFSASSQAGPQAQAIPVPQVLLNQAVPQAVPQTFLPPIDVAAWVGAAVPRFPLNLFRSQITLQHVTNMCLDFMQLMLNR